MHAGHGILERYQHILSELGVVAVPACVRDGHGELAHQVLNVMDDEGKALTVFRQQFCIEQGSRHLLLGEIARRLLADGKQQTLCSPN